MDNFKKFLEQRLSDDLPGRQAQQKMEPYPLHGQNSSRNYEPAHDDFRNSSVLVPLISWGNQIEVLFTLRTQSINHGGQLSFPGGGKEGDETIEETALREAHEEIGLHPENTEIIGRLTPLYVGHSDNMVTPVVAHIHRKQSFTRNPNEVEEIITVPMQDFVTPEKFVTEDWKLREIPYKVPYWDVHDVPLWGATAMMMSEMVELYREFLGER